MNINEIILFELHIQISNVNMAYFHSPRYRCKSCNDMMCPYQIESSQSSQCYHPLKQKLRSRKNLAIDVDTNDTLPSYKTPFICDNLHIFDSCPVCLKYKCYFSSQ